MRHQFTMAGRGFTNNSASKQFWNWEDSDAHGRVARMFAPDRTFRRIRYLFPTKRRHQGRAPAFPTLRMSLQKASRIDIASEYCFGSRRRSRLCLHLSRESDLFFIRELVRSHHLKTGLEITCQPGTPDWIRVAAVVNRLKASKQAHF